MTWKLATVNARGRSRVALRIEERFADVEGLAKAHGGPAIDERLTMLMVMEQWDAWHDFFQLASERLSNESSAWLSGEVKIEAPLQYPRKLLCAGANYLDHLKEMGGEPPDKSKIKPFFFMKPASSAIIGADEAIILPPISQKVDWEIELAAVIGRPAKNVPVERAREYVAGYTIVNDISARDIMQRPDWPRWVDWLASKGCDTFAPMGPYIVPQSGIKDPYNLPLTLSVNGEVKQNSNTNNLIFNVEEQIAFLSSMFTLEPGDVISTGTPAGVGAPRGTFLKSGDVVVANIEGIGHLRNPVR